MESASPRFASDETAIVDALGKYVWGNDNRDLDLLADSFSEDASCSGYVEEQLVWGPVLGRQKIVEELTIRIPEKAMRRHSIGSFRFIRLTHDEAEVHSYMVVTKAEEGRVLLEDSGWYRDVLVNEGGTWRIKLKEWHIDIPV